MVGSRVVGSGVGRSGVVGSRRWWGSGVVGVKGVGSRLVGV